MVAAVTALTPLLIFWSRVLFPVFLLAPFYSLPLLLIFRTNDIGAFAIGFQILSLFTGSVLLLRNSTIAFFNPSSIAIFMLTTLCAYGFFIPQTNATPFIVKVIACKVILIPVIFSMILYVVNDKNYICYIVKMIFLVCIANSIAGLIQIRLGTQKLIALGLPYGTQIREFKTGRIRALGLSLTNFEFALFSGLTAILCYAVISKIILVGEVSRFFAFITLVSSVVSMYTSITRQGIFLPLIGIIFLEIARPRNAIRIYTQLYFLSILVTFLAIANNLFLTTDSTSGRIQLWRTLLRENGLFIGNGIGFCGGATTSSFARNISQIFVDNFYISIFLQTGTIGLFLYIVSLSGFFYNTNLFGKAILLAIIFTSFVTELWDYSSVAGLALILIATLGQNNTEIITLHKNHRSNLTFRSQI